MVPELAVFWSSHSATVHRLSHHGANTPAIIDISLNKVICSDDLIHTMSFVVCFAQRVHDAKDYMTSLRTDHSRVSAHLCHAGYFLQPDDVQTSFSRSRSACAESLLTLACTWNFRWSAVPDAGSQSAPLTL
jgi:hypothetical protein